MVRLSVLVSLLLLFVPSLLLGDTETDPRRTRALSVQKAMVEAKSLLAGEKPAEAVAVLEAEILNVNGNENYLALMKDAYVAYLKELKRINAGNERIDHVRRQLQILAPKMNTEEIVSTTDAAPPAIAPAPKLRAPVFRAVPDDEDPFQQTPADRTNTADWRGKAKAAFEQKKYADAAAMYRQAQQAKLPLTAEERQAWGYCRLSDVVARLNAKPSGGAALAVLRKEAQEAAEMGGAPLEKFAQQVLAEIGRRNSDAQPASAIPDGWQTIETASFRILARESTQTARGIATAAEVARTATYEKWFGPAGANWSPRCDVWLHLGAADYAKATHQSTTSSGHASVGAKDGEVRARRIDLRLDDAALLEGTLPREVTYVVLADLFAEQPLPRWAEVGMTIHAEPASEVSRYLRAVPRTVQEKKLFATRDLLKMADFPEAEKITPFYVESVSLVDYLVRLKGTKAFALYLREAPRRGYEEALARHYGIKDADELHERWVKFALKGE